ncbi:Golgi transport complex subunit 4 [Madurella fahalii]|uniref:Golgi transport complex subunit 4 n=1 Tax=Madurella fahalii TaxID=1157608 RepID=A0ABQ0FX89_9PEZI
MAQAAQQDPLVNAFLLQKIDKLREKNIGKHVPLPQLVVVGDQSSGKSSLLESLTGIPFPRDVELCTRYATQITQRRDDVPRVEVSIIPGPRASEAHKKRVEAYRSDALSPENFRAKFPAILKEVNATMGIRQAFSQDGLDSGNTSDGYTSENSTEVKVSGLMVATSGGGSIFSEDVLRIEICGPGADYLTVIDVPGIFRTPTEGITTKEDMALVRSMVEGYIKDSRTVILAVLDSNVDIANQEILTLAEKYDQKGERTLGILTKPDKVIEQRHKASVCSIVRGKKKQLTLGYYVVRSRGADQDDADYERREELFNEEPWNSLPKERVGVQALRTRLADLLGDIAWREFPKLRKDIDEMLRAAEKERDSLGPSRKDEQKQRLFLSGMARQFQELVQAGLEAQYASDATFDVLPQLRLVTQVVNLADAFGREFQTMAPLRRFEREPGTEAPAVTGGVEEGTVEYEYNDGASVSSDAKESNESLGASADARPKHAQDLNPAQLLEAFPELQDIVSDEYRVDVPKGNIMAWIKDLHLRSRGMDLSTFSNAVWASAFKEQSSKWPSMSKAFVSRVVVAVHSFITSALHVVCMDRSVRDKLWSAMLDELQQRYKAGMSAAEFLVSAERDAKPYTLDHHFNENRQKSRGGRVADLLKDLYKSDQKFHFGKSESDAATVTIKQVRTATESKSNLDDIVERLHDDLSSYYEIARKRFVDNVLNQAVNYRLLFGPSTPLGLFSQEWVLGLDTEQLRAIAGESPGVTERRANLDRKIDDLQDAKKILSY